MSIETISLDAPEFVDFREELDLDKFGIRVREAEWGDAEHEVFMIRQELGEVPAERHPPNRTVTLKLRVMDEGDQLGAGTSLAEAAYKLQQKIGLIQKEGGWIKRSFTDDSGFKYDVGFEIFNAVIGGLHGWMMAHRDTAPDVTLVLTVGPYCYGTEEVEGLEVKEETGRRLEYTIEDAPGTAPGKLRLRVKNIGTNDWLGLIHDVDQVDEVTATNKLSYPAEDMTPLGTAVISSSVVPEIRAVGAVASGEGAISPGLPAGTEAGDLLVMVAESGGATAGTEANVALTAAGWTLWGLDQKKGNTRLAVLSRIATGVDPTLTNDTGDHQVARIIGIKRGTFDTGTPVNAALAGTQALTKAVSIPGFTTTRDNCLVLSCASGHLPDAATTAEFSATTNASLTALTERIDNTTSAGDGGALFVSTGVKATAGVIAATTCTAVTEAERAVISLAINGPGVVKASAGPYGALQAALSSKVVKGGVGHLSHIGGRRILARVYNTNTVQEDLYLQLEWRAMNGEWETNDRKYLSVAPGWGFVDLGEAIAEVARIGIQRWEFRILVGSAKSYSSTIYAEIDEVYILTQKQFVKMRKEIGFSVPPSYKVNGTPNPLGVAGEALNGKNMLTGGGKWETSGSAKGDFLLTGKAEPFAAIIKREAAEDTEKRKAFVSTPTMTNGIVSMVFDTYGLYSSIEGEGLQRQWGIYMQGGAVELRVGYYYEKATGYTFKLELGGTGVEGEIIKSFTFAGSYGFSDAIMIAIIGSKVFGFTGSGFSGIGNGGPLIVGDLKESKAGKIGMFEYMPKKAGIFGNIFQISGFGAYEANSESLVTAGRFFDVGTDGTFRQDASEDVWGFVPPDEGFYPKLAPSGLEKRILKGLVLPSQGEFGSYSDSGINKLSVVPFYRPAYHFTTEPAVG